MASFTSIERDDPPTRRKSCLSCTRSRRRCSQARPACQRCSQRGIDCRYPQGALARPAPPPPSVPEEQQVEPERRAGSLPPPPNDDISYLDILDPIFEPTDSENTAGLFSESLEFDDAIPLFDSGLLRPTPRLLTTAQHALDRSQPTVPQMNKTVSSRLRYAIDRISEAPCQMVLENQMPWCHARLYDEGMPRCMQCESFPQRSDSASFATAEN